MMKKYYVLPNVRSPEHIGMIPVIKGDTAELEKHHSIRQVRLLDDGRLYLRDRGASYFIDPSKDYAFYWGKDENLHKMPLEDFLKYYAEASEREELSFFDQRAKLLKTVDQNAIRLKKQLGQAMSCLTEIRDCGVPDEGYKEWYNATGEGVSRCINEILALGGNPYSLLDDYRESVGLHRRFTE